MRLPNDVVQSELTIQVVFITTCPTSTCDQHRDSFSPRVRSRAAYPIKTLTLAADNLTNCGIFVGRRGPQRNRYRSELTARGTSKSRSVASMPESPCDEAQLSAAMPWT